MKQTYDNYYREYFKTPSGKASQNKSNNKYRRKLKREFPQYGYNRAIRLRKAINKMKKRTSVGTRLTQDEFDTIKELQNLKITSTKAASIVKRSSSTIWHIYQCATLEEYHNKVSAAARAMPLIQPATPTEKKYISKFIVVRASGLDELAEKLTHLSDEYWSVTVLKTSKSNDGNYESLVKTVEEA